MAGISVIICCYNSELRLPHTLQKLIEQECTGFDWEIIVVDNASTDNTSSVAQQVLFAQTSVPYKIIAETKPGLSQARKAGQLAAKYPYLLFCDDDNWLANGYLQIAFDVMEKNQGIGVLGGKAEAVFESVKPLWFDRYQSNFAVGSQGNDAVKLSEVKFLYGAGFIIRKCVLEQLQKAGFNSLLSDRKGEQLISGGDSELCLCINYLGKQIAYTPQLQLMHFMTSVRMNWGYLKKLHYGFGRSRLYLDAYLYLEVNNEMPDENLKYPLWLDRFIHKLKEAFRLFPRVMFKMNEEDNPSVLQFIALKGELYELWRIKGEYSEVYKKILAFKKAIESVSL